MKLIFNHNKLVFLILTVILLSAYPVYAQIPSSVDTLKMGSSLVEPGEIAALAVGIVNTFAVGGFSSRLVFDQDIFAVHAVYLTERTENMNYLVVDTTDSGVARIAVFALQPRMNYLDPGTGDVFIIEFQVNQNALAGHYPIRFMNSAYGYYENHFADTSGYELILPVLSDGDIEVLPASSIEDDLWLPSEYTLISNYPNPFNNHTVISLNLAVEGTTCIVIYDMLGREIKEINLGMLTPGEYTAVWNGRDGFEKEVSSGVYCYTLYVNQESIQTQKMSLIK